MRAAILGAAVAAAALTVTPKRPEDGKYPGGVSVDPNDRPDIPDRVSIEQDSPYFFPEYPMLNIQINGKDSNQVVEYCKSEGWARLCLRNGTGRMKRDQKGRPITTTVTGQIRPYWRDQPIPNVAVVAPSSEPALDECPGKPFEKPTISREQARRMRQRVAQETKRAQRAGLKSSL